MAHIKLEIKVAQNLAKIKGKGRRIKNKQTKQNKKKTTTRTTTLARKKNFGGLESAPREPHAY